jgi:hypothetical protein
LDDVGNVDDPPNNGYVSDKPVSVQVSPNTEAGTDVTQKGGCDCIIATYQGADLLKGYNLEFAKGALEPALEEMMLGGTAIVDGADIIGVWSPGPLDCGEKAPSVAFEFWGDAFVGSTNDGTWPYFHFVFPKTTWQTGQQTYENNFSQPPFTGKAVANPLWGSGPYGDQPQDTPAESPGGYFFTTTLPTAACDYVDVTPGS